METARRIRSVSLFVGASVAGLFACREPDEAQASHQLVAPMHADAPAGAPATESTLASLERIVAGILRADYRGDLKELAHGHAALAAHEADPAHAGAVRYWRGFALWRAAINRINEPGFDRALATREFEDAATAFLSVTTGELQADAKSAAAGSLMGAIYLMGPHSEGGQAMVPKYAALIDESVAMGPENPRVLWIRGGQLLWTPAQYGGSRALAIAAYERGLAAIRKDTPASRDALAPRWGEPELLMSLAFAYANFEPLDHERAEVLAREALALQPEWHYVRDILLPDIVAKRGGKRE